MLAELGLLLAASSPNAPYEELQALVVESNVLLKATTTTRLRSFRALRELYALNLRVPLFRALRDLWVADPAARPLLALLCATARDPLLRASAGTVLDAPIGDHVRTEALSAAVAEAFTGRYNVATLHKIGQNAASSWAQSGHLQGRSTKVRSAVAPSAPSAAYALLLGHLCGARGEALFDTLWCRLLDAPVYVIQDQAFAASRLGWLEYRHSGMVTEITFRRLLPAEG